MCGKWWWTVLALSLCLAVAGARRKTKRDDFESLKSTEDGEYDDDTDGVSES